MQIHPKVLSNLTRGMDSLQRLAMELLNEGKDRRFVYWIIGVMWLLIIPCVEVFSVVTLGEEWVGPVLLLNPLIYGGLMYFYIKVKVWEKEHRAAWDTLVKKYKAYCLNLCVDFRSAPELQVDRIEEDLADIVDFILEAGGTLKGKKLELLQMIRRGTLDDDRAKVSLRSEITELEEQVNKIRNELREKMTLAGELFGGSFEDYEEKYSELFRLGTERQAKNTIEEETRTRHPFLARG